MLQQLVMAESQQQRSMRKLHESKKNGWRVIAHGTVSSKPREWAQNAMKLEAFDMGKHGRVPEIDNALGLEKQQNIRMMLEDEKKDLFDLMQWHKLLDGSNKCKRTLFDAHLHCRGAGLVEAERLVPNSTKILQDSGCVCSNIQELFSRMHQMCESKTYYKKAFDEILDDQKEYYHHDHHDHDHDAPEQQQPAKSTENKKRQRTGGGGGKKTKKTKSRRSQLTVFKLLQTARELHKAKVNEISSKANQGERILKPLLDAKKQLEEEIKLIECYGKILQSMWSSVHKLLPKKTGYFVRSYMPNYKLSSLVRTEDGEVIQLRHLDSSKCIGLGFLFAMCAGQSVILYLDAHKLVLEAERCMEDYDWVMENLFPKDGSLDAKYKDAFWYHLLSTHLKAKFRGHTFEPVRVPLEVGEMLLFSFKLPHCGDNCVGMCGHVYMHGEKLETDTSMEVPEVQELTHFMDGPMWLPVLGMLAG